MLDETRKRIDECTSEELGLILAKFFEQGFEIQQQIHAIMAELTKRQEENQHAPDQG